MKSIFITGGASGIGLAVARRFRAGGWFVGLGDVDAGGLARAADELDAWSCRFDVRDAGAWAETLDGFVAAAGSLDLLFNNAGIARYGMFEEVTPEESAQQIAINLNGVVNGAYAALPHLRTSKGRLVNTASCAALYGSPGLAVYSATKFAVRGLSEALDAEWSRHGVAVSCIMPWLTETPILDSGSAGSNRAIRDAIDATSEVTPVADVAEVVWQAAHSDRLHHVISKTGRRVGLFARLMPGALRKRMRAGVAA